MPVKGGMAGIQLGCTGRRSLGGGLLSVVLFAFVEPQLAFYLYDSLGFSTTSFGLIVGAYGLALVIGQATLGRAADRFGRRLPIAAGLLADHVSFSAALWACSVVLLLAILASLFLLSRLADVNRSLLGES